MTRLSTLLVGLGVVAVAACDRSRPDLGGTESTTTARVGASSAEDAPADFKSIAAKVAGPIADVRENEVVELVGDVGDLPLLEDIAIEVRKRGAHPIVLVSTEKLARRLYDEVPAKYDGQSPVANLKLAQFVDVFVATERGEGRTLRGVPPERQAAQSKASQPIFELARKRGIRTVILGNGLYPTEERAEQLGMEREGLAALMYGGIDVDYTQLERIGQRLAAALAGGKELRVTNPGGTDLRIGMAGRPVYVSDGVISAEDRKRGGSALSVWLPAGDVYFTLAPGSAEGILVADRMYYEGGRIDGLRLEIKGGKVTAMSARSGLDPLKARYEVAGAGRDLVSTVNLGINSSLSVPQDKAVNVWSRAGAVTLVVGNNQWAGGGNSSDFGMAPEVARATVAVDGKPIVQDGKLVGGPEVAGR